jgi:hypothetical protein
MALYRPAPQLVQLLAVAEPEYFPEGQAVQPVDPDPPA